MNLGQCGPGYCICAPILSVARREAVPFGAEYCKTAAGANRRICAAILMFYPAATVGNLVGLIGKKLITEVMFLVGGSSPRKEAAL